MLKGFGVERQHQDSSEETPLQILVFGDAQVGKTSILESYCEVKSVDETVEQTSGMEVHAKRLWVDRASVGAYLYDFSGDLDCRDAQEVYLRSIIKKSQVRGERFPFTAIFLFFDCRTRSSLVILKSWLDWFYNSSILIYQKLCSNNSKDFEKKLAEVPIVVFGNKIDEYNSIPFFFAEFTQLPADQRSGVQSLVDQCTSELRSRLGMGDCDNLVFITAVGEKAKARSIIDRVIIALWQKQEGHIPQEDGTDILTQTLGRVRKARGLLGDQGQANSLLQKLICLIWRKETLLPL